MAFSTYDEGGVLGPQSQQTPNPTMAGGLPEEVVLPTMLQAPSPRQGDSPRRGLMNEMQLIYQSMPLSDTCS